MATVSQLAEALRAVVDTNLTDVDQSSISSYLPSILTQKVALVIPPLRQSERADWSDLSGGKLEIHHEIPLEFFVVMANDPTGLALSVQRARDIPTEAMRVIADKDGTGYTLSTESPLFISETDENFIEANGLLFLRSRLIVRVYNEVSV